MSGLATNSINVYAPLGQPQSSQRARRLLYYLFVFFVGAIYFAAEQFNFKSERNVFVAKQQAPKQLVILAWNMYRPELLKGISNLDDAMTRTSSNTGNLVWMYAATTRIIDMNQVELLPAQAEGFLPDDVPNDKRIDIVYWPTANILRNDSEAASMANYLSRWSSLFTALHAPVVIVGLGAQFELGSAKQRDLGDHLGRLHQPSDMVLSEPAVNMLRIASISAPFIGTRGAFTEKVCLNHGIVNAQELGCPSLFLSQFADVGERVAHKIRTLPTNPRMAVTLPHFFRPKMVGMLLRFVTDHDDSIAIIQDTRDVRMLEQAERELGIRLPPSKTKYFTNVEDWQDAICKFDAIVGPRIHGGMIGFLCPIARPQPWHLAIFPPPRVPPPQGPPPWHTYSPPLTERVGNEPRSYRHTAPFTSCNPYKVLNQYLFEAVPFAVPDRATAPIPMLIIPLDLRVAELARSMKVPHLLMDHPVFSKRNAAELTVKDLFNASEFDASAFDSNRYKQASVYVDHFESMGLPPTNTLRTLATMHAS